MFSRVLQSISISFLALPYFGGLWERLLNFLIQPPILGRNFIIRELIPFLNYFKILPT